MEQKVVDGAGAIALAGSGEYTAAMDDADRYLLETVGGAVAARVALLPTASGLEPGMPASWNERGRRHFAALGVADIRSIDIIDRASAADPAQLALLRGANFFYLSGGNPQHVIESLRGTPAWEVITTAYAQGAVLAGCSAGAMALCGQTLSLRRALAGESVEWVNALAVVPNLIVFPHFDRTSRFMSPAAFRDMLRTIPAGRTVVGVDEDTALVRVADGADAGISHWRVFGRQTVRVFTGADEPTILRTGDEVTLHA